MLLVPLLFHLAAVSTADSVQAWHGDSLTSGSRGKAGFAIPSRERLVSWLQPPSGGVLEGGWSVSEARESKTWSDLEGQVVWLQSIGPWISLGGGARWSRQSAEIAALGTPARTDPVAKACVAMVCWEARQEHASYPLAAIFQKDLDTLIAYRRSGNLLAHAPGSGGAYWLQTFDAHVGSLHWRGVYAPGAWKGLLQQVALEDLPAGLVRWGVSFSWAGAQAMTGFSLSTAPWKLSGWHLGRRSQELSWEPLRFDLLYARTDQARLSVGTRLLLSDPFRGVEPR